MSIPAAPSDDALASLGARLRALLLRVQRDTAVPGLAAAVAIGGRRVSVAVGSRSPGAGDRLVDDARFHLGCTTKLLLSAVTLELVQERRGLDLDGTLGEHLPELRGGPHGAAVRVRHLLSHTSGYRGTNLFEPAIRDLRWEGLVGYLRSAPALFPPGSVFNYEHTESVLLGRILERVTGRPCLALVRERVFEPLGIAPGRLADFEADLRSAGRNELDPRTGRFVAVESRAELNPLWHAAFSTYTVSLDDMVRIGEALMIGGDAKHRASPLTEETRGRLVRPVVRLPRMLGGPARESLPVAFGLGAAELPGAVHGNNGLTHGQCLALRFAPAAHVVAAAGLNATLPHLRDFILSAVLAEAGIDAPGECERPRLDVPLAELRGQYLGPGSAVLSASLADERLVLELEGSGARRAPIGELVADDEQGLVLHTPIPQLSVGVFRAPEGGAPCFMLGLNAYRRITTSG